MESENKLKILFTFFPFEGHYNPCIAIGECLDRRGHRVIFAVYESLMNKFITYGFEEILIPSEINVNDEFYKRLLNIFNERKVYDAMITPLEQMILNEEKASMMRFEYAKHHSQSLKAIIDSVDPNIIISDAFFLPTVPSVVKSRYPWVLLFTHNPIRDNHYDRLRPLNYDDTQWSMHREEYYHTIQPIKEKFNKWMIEEGLLPLKDNKLYLESPFLNIYNFPKELGNCHLSPHSTIWKQFDAFVRTENDNFIIPQYLSEKTGKLIFFTMGTLLSINLQMMEHLIQILSKSSHRFIVSKGPFADRYELPDNMYGERTIPQIKVLPLVDMIIFHGGNNTLVEAFYFGKPMIIMPLKTDQFINAERVEEKGFGIQINPMTCKGDELINAIEKILNDEQLINRMKEISQRIQKESKSDHLAHAIEDIVKQMSSNTVASVVNH